MNMKGFDLLSQIYKLLAEADLRAVHEARLSVGDEGPVADILVAMASALSGRTAPRAVANGAVRPTRRSGGNGGKPRSQQLRNATPLAFLLEMSPRPRAELLLQAFQKAGIPVAMKPKDGQGRAIARANRLLSEMDPERADRVLRRLRAALGVDETQGWINVIRTSE